MADQSELATSLLLKTAITIGDTEYCLDTSQIPYLSTFVAFESKARPDAKASIHGPIPLFSVALKGLESGYRYCFRSIPADLSQHHILCETYDFLGIDVLGGHSLDKIFEDLKAGKTDYDEVKKSDRTKARDEAFRFLYLLLLREFEDEKKDAAKVFNAVLFVVSHPGTFKWRARTVVRMAYEERFVVTAKQRSVLDKWVEKEQDMSADVTTEEEDLAEHYYSDYCSDDWDS